MLPPRESEEKRRHSTVLVPYSFYVCVMPRESRCTPMHWHSEFELNYVLSGHGEFTCGGEKLRAEAGDILLVQPNQLHAAFPAAGGEMTYYALVFSTPMLGASRDLATSEYIAPLASGTHRSAPIIPRNAENYPQMLDCVRQIFDCLQGKIPCPELLLKSQLLRFFWLLETDPMGLVQTAQRSNRDNSIRPALEYMVEHYNERTTVGRLADLCRMSESSFMRIFKQIVGVSAIEYLCQLRVNAACEALSNTDSAVADIAFRCGYGNLSNFNRQFRRITGCSPSEFRKGSKS